MAKSDSNRDRIGKMFELISPQLERFISEAVDPQLAGGSWVELLAAKDKEKGIDGVDYDRDDPLIQLRFLTENVPNHHKSGWYPFDGKLSPAQRSFASELRETRNSWAHMKSFADDDAYRSLDTAERLLTAIGSADVADQIRGIRLEVRRSAAEKDDRKVLQASSVSPESKGLSPWREVLHPHEDVASGNFQAAEFAADLYKVSTTDPDAGKDYSDPVEFFSRTYLTEGLRDLVDRSVKRLSGDENASPVINLQTNFGGGKTHSMLALWHLAGGEKRSEFSQEVQELLGESGYDDIPSGIRRVALVGNHLSTSGSTKDDGTVVNTIWGELAWQLGGAEAFSLVAESDADRTPPGQALHELLDKYSPALILIDEWVAYARSLVGRDDLAAGTFEDQFTFAQALTEAVKSTPGVMLAISIPASEAGGSTDEIATGNSEEVGGENGKEALKRLQNVVRRIADQWRPASANESYEIVRQRLFQPADAQALAEISATAERFVEMYQKGEDDFPKESRQSEYLERIKRTYPIHPELFDRLYEDWSSLERFQRTRGVLRLMNTVIHALWVGEDSSPLIMPSSVPLSTAMVNSELTQYLEDSWKAIIDADVDGPNSEPARIDSESRVFGERSVTKRLARTVFMGSAPTVRSAHKGIETQRIFIGTATPGDKIGNFHSALNKLSDRTTYFYSGSGKYWYDLQANISRQARDLADGVGRPEVWKEIVDRLAGEAKRRGSFAAVHVCPEETSDIPDTDEARLVILHPKLSHKRGGGDSTALEFALNATENRGGGSRTYRNMLVFLAADESGLETLENAVRMYLGWSEVLDKQADLDLTQSQKDQAEEKKKAELEKVDSRLLVAYQWALIPHGQPIEIRTSKVDGQSENLAEQVTKRLENDGDLAVQQAGANVVMQLNNKDTAASLWKSGSVAVKDLWETYAQYPYMPRLIDSRVLREGLKEAPVLWQEDGYALAAGYDDDKKRFIGLVIPTDDKWGEAITEETLVVKPDLAIVQRDSEGAGLGDPSSSDDGEEGESSTSDPAGGESSGEGQTPAEPQAPKKTRFFGNKELSADRYAMDFKQISDEIIAHLTAAQGAEIKVTIEIEATTPDGFEESQVRTISENAGTLKFDQSGFEES